MKTFIHIQYNTKQFLIVNTEIIGSSARQEIN
uniref:Uncharacterized protein n=1 Tax=Emiliania huxleyi TaxID=2903 RepID=Q4G3E1_EMIHU|nr:hypothetical protein EmhuCp018 [Emiliania huxleyi]AAX13825.1 unknown [Emiliania huxleyi]